MAGVEYLGMRSEMEQVGSVGYWKKLDFPTVWQEAFAGF